ncbi:MAG: class I adenylate-forming enzyme family protein [Candidatus Dormibacteria bacterium]
MTSPHNLARLGDDALERLGDRDAVFFEGKWHRAAAMHERATRMAGGFARLGVRPGDRVVVLMPNSPEVGIVYNALWRAGAVITPAMFLLTAEEIRHILQSSRAVAVVTSPEFEGRVREAAVGLDGVRWILGVGDDQRDAPSLDRLAAEKPLPIVTRRDDDLAALLFTGGTTGRSKGVMLSHENLWMCGQSTHAASYVPGLRRTLVPLPLAHAFGIIVTVTGMHAAEPGFAVLQKWFDPTDFLAQVQQHRIQAAVVVPTMLQILLSMALEDHDLSSLQFLACGAAPLAPEVAREVERRIPGVVVREGYGCTESGGVISTNPPTAVRPGSVGKALPGYEVRIVDDDDRDVAAGDSGEVICRAKGIMQGYWESPELSAETLRGGWLHTGDIGRLDQDGYLYIVDRKKDLVIRGGFNIYPRDVEDALLEHPEVAVAGVVGRPDQRLGEEVIAFVSLRPGATVSAETLVEFARERVGAHKYPREVRLLDWVPLTPVGKVDRKALRGMAGEG